MASTTTCAAACCSLKPHSHANVAPPYTESKVFGGQSLSTMRRRWTSASLRRSAEPLRPAHVRAAADGEQSKAAEDPPAAAQSAPASISPSSVRSILCNDCDGNGAVVCRQCQGGGVNLEDHFGGRFKAGQTCWLCRGKKHILCGNCNGAGFVGGFLSGSE